MPISIQLFSYCVFVLLPAIAINPINVMPWFNRVAMFKVATLVNVAIKCMLIVLMHNYLQFGCFEASYI